MSFFKQCRPWTPSCRNDKHWICPPAASVGALYDEGDVPLYEAEEGESSEAVTLKKVCDCSWSEASGCGDDDGTLCWSTCCAEEEAELVGFDKSLVSRDAGPASEPGEAMVTGELTFVGREGKLFANGVEFKIKGVNWYGSEDKNGAVEGLEHNGLEHYMRFLKNNGFNALRLLFNHHSALQNAPILNVGLRMAPELKGLPYLQMFKAIARAAANHGLIILMACHRTAPSTWPGEGKWYDAVVSEEQVFQSWRMISKELCNQWNVFGVDLQNEPHSSSWGKGGPLDWDAAATLIGNHVLEHCHRWLIFVEGVGYSPGAPGYDDPAAGIWWGENLAGAVDAPVMLSDPTKLVYSPHTYGPAVYMQKFFSEPDFPHNMDGIWAPRWGILPAQTGVPLVIGEMGGTYEGIDKEWQDYAVSYMRRHGIGIFYFCLNPGSIDTGGLFLDTLWSKPSVAKLKLLADLPSTEVLPLLRPHA